MNKEMIEINKLLRREEKYKTNHLLHLVLSIVSAFICFGFPVWVLVWLICSVSNAIERKKCRNELKKFGY